MARSTGGGGALRFSYTPSEEAKFKRDKLQRRMLPLLIELVADLAEQVGEQQLKTKPKRTGVLRGRGAALKASSAPPEGQALKDKGSSLKALLGQFNALGSAGPADGSARPTPKIVRAGKE